MLYVPQLLLHVSRPVRWDSDHVVLLDDETQAIASEIVRHDLFDRVHIGLDFFDASINRIAAWVIGTRNMKKALLRALLEPTAELRKLEAAGDYTARLALLEEQKSLPWQAVKISAAMLYVPQLLLHVSRPVRWDSDHVVLLDDETQAIASEIVRHDLFDRVHIGLDFFDASINRIAAWVIGTRNMKKALLRALLEPTAELRKLEAAGDYTARLALLEEQKSLPWQAVCSMPLSTALPRGSLVHAI